MLVTVVNLMSEIGPEAYDALRKTIRYQEQLEEGKGFKLEYINIMRKGEKTDL